MSQWKKVRIGDFLHQYRNTIYVEDTETYRQITISSKDGIKYRCSKIGKEIGRKRQFKIDLKQNPNTVIFTRQGLHEGSIGIAPLEVDGCIATENMPMFSVDETIVLSDYLKYFFKSPVFINLIGTLTPTGSAQKAIHERDLLPLEIFVPDLVEQERIISEVTESLKKTNSLQKEIDTQKEYAKLIRQNILQDAIEGKLTADWRKSHPVIKGNPDYDAEALFEKIQKEKESDKKQKELPAITDEEKPFEIPKEWKWVRLGECSYNRFTGPFGSMLHKSDYIKSGIPLINPTNIKDNFIDYQSCMMISTQKMKELKHYVLAKNDIILARRGDLSKCGIIENDLKQICGTGCFFMKLILIDTAFFKLVYQSCKAQAYLLQDSIGQTMANLNQKLLEKLPIPLPPLCEQEEIVQIVESKLGKIGQIDFQIQEREIYAKQLIQSILKDTFEER